MLYLILLLKTHKMCKFHRLFKCNIWAQNELILPFLILVMHTKSIFTNFCHLPLLFSNFYHFLPPSANFHYLPPSFASSQLYATFHQSKMVLFFFFFHLLACNNPTILLDAMLHILILCLFFSYMFCVIYIYYTVL